MKIIDRTHNALTNEITDIEREMTVEELTQYETSKAEGQARQEAEIAKTAEKAALLERLGITQDEAKLLLS